jgi:hypothetical protein
MNIPKKGGVIPPLFLSRLSSNCIFGFYIYALWYQPNVYCLIEVMESENYPITIA